MPSCTLLKVPFEHSIWLAIVIGKKTRGCASNKLHAKNSQVFPGQQMEIGTTKGKGAEIFLSERQNLLGDFLSVEIQASICGAEEWTEIALFGESKKKWFKTFLRLPNGIPSHDTFG